MNILSYIHVHRLPNPSGVGRVIDRLLSSHAATYPEAKHRMLVDQKFYDKAYLGLSSYWKTASFISHRRPTSLQQAMWTWGERPLAEKYWSDVDVVYCPAESYVPTKQAKLICTIHDVAGFEPDLYPNTRSNKWHCIKWRYLFQAMAKGADAVVTVSEFSASRIAHFFPELKNKLSVIYNAPHTVFGAPVPESLKKEVHTLSKGRPFVLVPGGLSLRKNAELIIKTAPLLSEKLKDVQLIISGTCGEDYRDRLSAVSSDHITLAGYVSDELLNALYHQAASVWFPSRYEGFGMPVIEAMAAGAPVVASHTSSIPEVVGSAALLCDMDSADEHFEALRHVVESGREKFQPASIAHSERYTWEKSAGQLEHLFRSL